MSLDFVREIVRDEWNLFGIRESHAIAGKNPFLDNNFSYTVISLPNNYSTLFAIHFLRYIPLKSGLSPFPPAVSFIVREAIRHLSRTVDCVHRVSNLFDNSECAEIFVAIKIREFFTGLPSATSFSKYEQWTFTSSLSNTRNFSSRCSEFFRHKTYKQETNRTSFEFYAKSRTIAKFFRTPRTKQYLNKAPGETFGASNDF